jgi:crotonobetainyl-CoA:carnitine CoA-transferase CaiB-like acyl-CoA transferase
VWAVVAGAVAGRPVADLVARGVLLDLAVAALPAAPPAGGNARSPAGRAGVLVRPQGPAPPRLPAPAHPGDPVDLTGLLVVDLSSLWAGPLCAGLLAGAGATVVKVESSRRPDGARRGPPAFFDVLNGAKRSVALDLDGDGDRNRLVALLRRADVVVESSRPRALAQWGIDAAALVATGPPVWVSVTGHGRDGAAGQRVGFGDDAAVAGGLVVPDGAGPLFCADAVADPLTGVAAARAAVDALRRGGRVLLDVALAAVAAEHAGPPLAVPTGLVGAEPRVRPVMQRAPALGAHTAAVLGELDIA